MKVRCCEYKVVSEVTWDYLLNLTVQSDLNGAEVLSIAIDEVQPTTVTDTIADTSVESPELGSKWTVAEDTVLVKMRKADGTFADISKVIGRSSNACRKRFKRFKIMGKGKGKKNGKKCKR